MTAGRKANPSRPRRARGHGKVYWDEARERWRGKAPNGRWVSGKTKAAAEDKIKVLMEQDAVDAALGRRNRSTMTVDELLDRYTAAVVDAKKPGTRDNYVYAIKHLRAHLGTIPLADLTVDDVDDALLATFKGKVKSKRSLRLIRSLLRDALNYALARDWVSRNVALMAVLPAAAKPSRRGVALTDEKYPGKLRELLAAVDERYRTLFTVQVEQALRPGEANGLTLQAIDLDAETIHVFQQLSYGSNKSPSGLTPVKTGNESRGLRTLKMTPRVADLLRPLVEARRLELEVYPEWPRQWRDLLFLSRAGTPHSLTNMGRALKAAAVKVDLADLDLRRYDLRHTACQMLLDDGVPIDQVADYLGHEDLRMVRGTYSHKSTRVLDPRTTPSEPS